MKKTQSPRSLDDIETRKAISSTAVKAFIGIMDTWDASTDERCAIMGGLSEETYQKWTEGKVGTLTQDQLERIGHILGIHKNLCLLFSEEAGRMRWFKSPNHDGVFQGKSPYQLIASGKKINLSNIRAYIKTIMWVQKY
ncbi:antitoxin Xre-like helix-turn-helix domain-containing protein [Kordiimonas pumila]|uniref:Antitoxin Xre-like helix-turn-helix domain-containing protein n=1 Tax=Kordiimonas pumila TaxID=2161677 RepID=A0ABV7D2S2_9PROT|nr:antitoxin Xre-like helix-turn-helix domain-containing protein [Kordiimonas pumila]